MEQLRRDKTKTRYDSIYEEEQSQVSSHMADQASQIMTRVYILQSINCCCVYNIYHYQIQLFNRTASLCSPVVLAMLNHSKGLGTWLDFNVFTVIIFFQHYFLKKSNFCQTGPLLWSIIIVPHKALKFCFWSLFLFSPPHSQNTYSNFYDFTVNMFFQHYFLGKSIVFQKWSCRQEPPSTQSTFLA